MSKIAELHRVEVKLLKDQDWAITLHGIFMDTDFTWIEPELNYQSDSWTYLPDMSINQFPTQKDFLLHLIFTMDFLFKLRTDFQLDTKIFLEKCTSILEVEFDVLYQTYLITKL